MAELGTKHECSSCSTKFYDLGKAEPICPKCGLNQLAEEQEEPEPVAEEVVEEETKEGPAQEAEAAEPEPAPAKE